MSILERSGAASVLILAALVLRQLTLYRLPKGTFLALWWAVICRLLIPFSIPARFSAYTALHRLRSAGAVSISPAPVVPGTTPVVPGPAGPLPDLPLPDAVVPTAPMPVEGPGWTFDPLVLVYLLGVLACALFFAVAYVRCRRKFRTALPVDSPFLREWKQSHPIPVQIKRSDRISAPLTYGLLRPVVLMPKGTDWADEETLGYVLAHEYVHIRRGDLWMKLALAICLCLHWFNPLVWLMYRLANRDMELACDEAVVKTLGLETRPAYAMALIKWEETRRGPTPLCGNFSQNAMEERVIAIMKLKKHSAVTMLAAITLVVGLTAAFATSCASAGGELPPEGPSVQDQGDKNTAPDVKPVEGPDQSEEPGFQEVPIPETKPKSEEDQEPIRLPEKLPEKKPEAVRLPEDPQKPEPTARPVLEDRWGLPDADPIPMGTEIPVADRADEKALLEYLKQVRGVGDGDVCIRNDEDGNRTVIVSYTVSELETSFWEKYPDGEWPKNSKGMTYGNMLDAEYMGHDPDLVMTRATNGESGYILAADNDGYFGYPGVVNSPEDGAAYSAWLKTQPTTKRIPVYDVEMDHVVGYFELYNSEGYDWPREDIEEELETVAQSLKNQGWSDKQVEEAVNRIRESKGG